MSGLAPLAPASAAELVAGTGAAVLLVQPDGRLVAANLTAERLLPGASTEQALGLLTEARGLAELLAAVRHVARRGECRGHQTTFTCAGDRRTFAWSLAPAAPLPDGAGELVSLVGIDISATVSELDGLHTRANTDELTGLANRSGLLQALTQRAGSGAHVLFCDLNGFKAVNDTHGHGAGDQVLVEVARRFVRAVRGEDLVARLGGDEFVVLAPPSPTADAGGLRRRIVGAVQQPMLLPGGLVVLVGVTVGMAELSPGVDPLDVLQQADAAMYEGKPTRRSIAAVIPAPR